MGDQRATDGSLSAPPGPLRPLVWLSAGLAAGVALGGRELGGFTLWWVLALGTAAAALLLRRWPRLAWALALAAAMTVGAWRAQAVLAAWERRPVARLGGAAVTVDALALADPVARRGGGSRVDLRVTRMTVRANAWQPLSAKLRVISDEPLAVRAADRVVATVELTAPDRAGNPGQFSQRRFLRREGLDGVAEVASLRVLAHEQDRGLPRLARRLRAALCGSITRAMPPPCAAQCAQLLNSLVFGAGAAPVDEVTTEAFRRAGLSHLLVASGAQVSLLLALILPLARAGGGLTRLGVALGVVLVGAYVLVTGAEPSILRAGVMGLVALGAWAWSRDPDPITALAAAVAALLLASPLLLFDAGFQLSFAATAGLLLLGLPLAAMLERWLPRWLAGLLSLTLAAQLAVAPVLVWHFRRYSLVGLGANLLGLPLAALLVPLGLAASVTGLVVPRVAEAVNVVTHSLLMLLTGGVGLMARAPGGYLEPVVMAPARIVLMLAGLAVGGAWLSSGPTRWRPSRRFWLAAAAVAALACAVPAWQRGQAGLTVTFLDVGNGDSVLVRGPSGRSVLVDGGPYVERDGQVLADAGADRVVPALMLLGVSRLDAVMGTHEHADHVGGLPSVIAAFRPQRVMLAAPRGSAAVERVTDAARRIGVQPEGLRRGQRLDLGRGAALWVLWPPASPVRGTDADVNNNAAVIKVTYGRTSVLLASDLEREGETYLLRHRGDLRATVLKVPHQGAAGSCGDALLDAVAPAHAVVSVGPNAYGHPAESTLARLAARGTQVHRTDSQGMVTCRSDGRTVALETYGRW